MRIMTNEKVTRESAETARTNMEAIEKKITELGRLTRDTRSIVEGAEPEDRGTWGAVRGGTKDGPYLNQRWY